MLLTLETESVPRVRRADQLTVSDPGFANDGISYLTARLGYQDHPSLPTPLREAVEHGLEADEDDIEGVSYFLSITRLRVTRAPGMAR